MNKSKLLNKIFEIIFLICSIIAIISVVMITLFIFMKGLPAFSEIGFKEILLGQKWNPSKDLYGILPMIVATLSMTFLASLIGIPIGIFAGVFISEYCSKKVAKFIDPAVELLAGIPSVVYGFFGLIVIVPIIGKTLGGVGEGSSLLAGAIILSIMILPTIISTTKTALKSIPKEYLEGSLALGASKEHTIMRVLLPASKSGIFAGVILALGRAIGETMAVILVSGNATLMPHLFKEPIETLAMPVRTLTANIALEMGYATGVHQQALFATAVVLFVIIIFLNTCLGFFKKEEY